MNWDQIENKWVAMTHRIRADWKDKPQVALGAKEHRRTKKADEAVSPVKLPAAPSIPDGNDGNPPSHP